MQCMEECQTDTTAVNTGHRNGVVTRLQRQFQQKGLDEPQFIGRQHHILDLILRHFLESFFPTESRSPNINYNSSKTFWQDMRTYKKVILEEKRPSSRENPGWRDDFRFLFELREAHNFYQKERKWPQLQWHKLPSLHSARFNSRGIFVLIAFFLIPKWRDHLKTTCDFIATVYIHFIRKKHQ